MIRTQTLILHQINLYKIQKNKGKYVHVRDINHICEEADRLKNHCARSQPNLSQSGAKIQAAGDEALAAMGSEGKRRRKGKCHNCGKQGHWARKCQSPKKEVKPGNEAPKAERSNKPETKPIGSVNAVTTCYETTPIFFFYSTLLSLTLF